MPVYEYECDAGHKFETEQSITGNAIKKCPNCNKPCKRLLFPVGFQLSGDGWAKDGYSYPEKRSKDSKPTKR